MKAVFAGVQHGDRPLRAKEADELRCRLAALDDQLAPHEPRARPRPTLLLDTDAAMALGATHRRRGVSGRHGPRPARRSRRPRPIADAGQGLFLLEQDAGPRRACREPKVRGRYRIWLSWGCGHPTHAADARYFLDQTEIARVDQRRFADGSGDAPGQSLWSGFHDAGIHELTPQSRILLRGERHRRHPHRGRAAVAGGGADEAGKAAQPWLRAPVNRLKNVERFAPVEAKYVRMNIFETTQLEPCIDELEVFSTGAKPRNVALASAGTRATASSTLPGYAIHKLEHINDGKYGNSWSWISNERGKGWVQLEFAQTERIDRIIWSRDREENGRYNDRTPTKYVFEVATEPGRVATVASSDDRLPKSFKAASLPNAARPGRRGSRGVAQAPGEKRDAEARSEGGDGDRAGVRRPFHDCGGGASAASRRSDAETRGRRCPRRRRNSAANCNCRPTHRSRSAAWPWRSWITDRSIR